MNKITEEWLRTIHFRGPKPVVDSYVLLDFLERPKSVTLTSYLPLIRVTSKFLTRTHTQHQASSFGTPYLAGNKLTWLQGHGVQYFRDANDKELLLLP